jgi:hypothetical protein
LASLLFNLPLSFPLLVLGLSIVDSLSQFPNRENVMPRLRKVRERLVPTEKKTSLVDISTSKMFSILASDDFARFLDGLVVQTENGNQLKPTKEIVNV